jgi:hypothetical protein
MFTAGSMVVMATTSDNPSANKMDRDTKIAPVLKAWLNTVLVPALVRQYLDECRAVDDNGDGKSDIRLLYSTQPTVGRRMRPAEDPFPFLDSGDLDEEAVQ